MANVYHAQKIAILANTIDNYVDGKIDACGCGTKSFGADLLRRLR